MQSDRSHQLDDSFPLPGDRYIAGANSTLFDLMYCLTNSQSPSDLMKALDLTPDQLDMALTYLNAHRSECESAYRTAVAAYNQRLLTALDGAHRASWKERNQWLVLFGFGAFMIVMTVIEPTPDSPWLLMLFGGLLCLISLLGPLVQIWTPKRYSFTDGWVRAARYGLNASWSLPYSEIAEIEIGGSSLTFLGQDGRTYRMLYTRSMREALERWSMDEQFYRALHQDDVSICA